MSPGGVAVIGGVGMLVLMVIVWLLGGNPLQLLQQMPQQQGQVQQGPGGGPPPGQEELKHYVGVVLHDTEVVWDELFRQHGAAYRKPKLVLFTDQVDSACGFDKCRSRSLLLPRR